MSPLAAGPTSLTGDFVVYVLCPLIVIAIASAAVWATKIHNRINEHGQALALMLQDVAPTNAPSLRELVQKHSERLVRIETQLSLRQIPVTSVQTPEVHHE